MVFHKTLPSPSPEEELSIDHKLRELADLSWKLKKVSSTDISSAQHALVAENQLSSHENKKHDDDHIFHLTLHAVRAVYVRRTVAKISRTCNKRMMYKDPYKILYDTFPKSHFRRPFILLDQLNAMLSAEYQVRELQLESKAISQLDNEALQLANEYMEVAKLFFERAESVTERNGVTDTTLFTSSTQSLSDELFQETKIHFARAVSLYHSKKAYDICAQWADILQNVLQLYHRASPVSLENSDAFLGEVMTVKAFSLTVSGNHVSGVS